VIASSLRLPSPSTLSSASAAWDPVSTALWLACLHLCSDFANVLTARDRCGSLLHRAATRMSRLSRYCEILILHESFEVFFIELQQLLQCCEVVSNLACVHLIHKWGSQSE
jgi:argininosuccinate lyase